MRCALSGPMVQTLLKNIGDFDVYHELRRARTVNVWIDKKLDEHSRLLEEDNEIDESYKIFLLSILHKGKRLESHNKQNDRENNGKCNVFEESALQRPKSCNKQRGRVDTGECNVLEKSDPQILESHMECKDRDSNRKCNVLEENDPQRVESQCKRKHRDDSVDCDANEKKDPDYDIFLKHLKGYGKSYALEYEKDGSTRVFQYETAIGLHNEHEQEPRRESNTPTKQKFGTSRQMPCAANQLKQCQQSKSVKKTVGWIQRETGNPTDKVEMVKGSPTDMQPDPKCLFLHRNARRKHYVGMHKSNTAANEKLDGMNGDHEEKGNNLSDVRRPQVQLHNHMPCVQNKHEHNPQQPSIKKTNDAMARISRNETKTVENGRNSLNNVAQVPEYHNLHQNVKHENDSCVYKQSACNVVEKKIHGANRRIVKSRMAGFENQCEHHLQSASVKKIKDLSWRKPRNEVERIQNVKGLPSHTVPAPVYKHQMVELEDDYFINTPNGHTVVNEMSAVVNRRKYDLQPASLKNTKSLTMGKSRNETGKADTMKYSYSEYSNVKAAENAMENRKVGASVKEEIRDESMSDVELLSSVACDDAGIFTPFVSSKKFHDNEKPGALLANNVFRRQVLDFLRRPYAKDEYIKLREAVQAGSYFNCHPDLKKSLTKWRYNRGKLLTILRGFFYWLQNVTQEGAFKPWKDRECLEVDPLHL